MRGGSARWEDTPALAQVVFAAAFILGAGGILVLKVEEVRQLYVTAWPVVVMALYASLVFVPPFKLRPDQTGDNLYYLGFLFTLISLGYSLYQFTLDAGVEGVVQNFGIAVASTIAGVFGRVLLNQMRTDPFETERAVRMRLAESARTLRGELDGAIVEFATYRRQVQQASADGLREMSDLAGEQLGSAARKLEQEMSSATAQFVEHRQQMQKATAEGLRHLSQLASQEIQGSADRFHGVVDQTCSRIEALVGDWAGSSEDWISRSNEVAGAMSALSTRLELVRAPADILEEKLGPTAASLESIAASSAAIREQMAGASSQIRDDVDHMSLIVNRSYEILDLARQHSEAMSRAGDIVSAAREQISRMEESERRLGAAVGAASERLSDGAASFSTRLDAQLEQAGQLVAVYQREARDLEQRLVSRLEALSASASAANPPVAETRPGTGEADGLAA